MFVDAKHLIYWSCMDFFQFLKGKPPETAGYDISKGVELLNKAKFKDALVEFNRAIKADPANAEAYSNRGTVKRKLGMYKEALKDYDTAIRIDPGNAEAFGNRAVVNHKLGKIEEAIADYNQAIALKPAFATMYNNRANIKYKLEKYEEAIADYSEAIKLKPDYPMAYYYRGRSLAQEGKQKQALKDFDRAIKLQPDNGKAYYYRGVARFLLGMYKEAADDLVKTVKSGPKNSDALYKLASVKSRLGDKEGAIKSFTAVINIEPKNSKAYYNRGNAYFAIGKYDEAVKDYSAALKVAPNLILAYYGRSTARIASGKKEKAIQDLERFIQLSENSPNEDTRLVDEAINSLEILKNSSVNDSAQIRAVTPKALYPMMDDSNHLSGKEPAIKNIKFEAILYIDICDSTVIIDAYGEIHFNKILGVFSAPLAEYKKKYGCTFDKSTGDGWMMTFDKCVDAVDLALSTMKMVEKHNTTASDDLKIDMRIGIDCGQVLIREDADRCGDPANVAKRIEGLTRDSFVEVADEIENDFPVKNRVFISAKVLTMISDRKDIKHRAVGWAEMKGKPGVRFQIMEVLWRESLSAA